MSVHSFCLVKEVMVRENVDRSIISGIETFFRNFEECNLVEAKAVWASFSL